MAEVLALHSMFEGMFVRALRVDGDFKAQLRAKGFDLDRAHPRYPITVWLDCVDLAATRLYPGESRAQAWQQLGRRFIDGYFETLVGKLITASFPFLSAKSFVTRVPRFMTSGLEGTELTLTWLDAHTATLRIVGSGDISAAFMSGILSVCFERLGAGAVKLEARSLGGRDSELRVELPRF
jgi:uncharacterized protein (TIGR02265 family)